MDGNDVALQTNALNKTERFSLSEMVNGSLCGQLQNQWFSGSARTGLTPKVIQCALCIKSMCHLRLQ